MSFNYAQDDDIPAVVIDNGSHLCKAGFAGDDAPRSIIPPLIGRPRYMYENWMVGMDGKDAFIGDEIQNKRDVLAINQPIKKGIITDWDDMEKIWQYIFDKELHVSPEHHPVLLTDVPLNPKINREKMCEIMFETFNTPLFSVSLAGVLGMYSSGNFSAITLDVGHEVSHVIAIYEGYILKHAIDRMNFGGNDLTDYLLQMLNGERSHSLTCNSDKEIVRKMKESLGYTELDFEKTMNCTESSIENIYELPDGRRLTVGNERFRCTEPLFQPHLLGKDFPGLHQFLYSSLMKCDIDTRRDIMRNVILSGGCTMFTGLRERMVKELTDLVPKTMKVKVIAPPERKLSVWIGGSVLASLSMFQNLAISKLDYEENGTRIVHLKCT
ncbi:actin, cytoplasmic-like [Ruditapes philippinarum]|uniref:actin, cytoplasmic-like n=1 Tax=Ruditapes philippinarum TaxID=129788 RepID=UPI00295B90C0|nr:actin, cytoplasmic-like [Ruditapes philippinarum]XP_060576249.1 actin, cytoplasmic-like [Ruditapes philippinarum]